MCGICGFLATRSAPAGPIADVRAMASTIAHRGPDDAGAWTDVDRGIALGHRRLSILDLSAEGHQPMHSESARYTLSYNGEIYNFAELRDELRGGGHRFRGSGDTEVILAGVEEWGLENAVRRLRGIFAFALWDAHTQTIHLVRDHLGVKPLYYGWHSGTLVFGSELRPLIRYPGFDTTLDRDSIALLLRYNCIPAPYSIYRAVRKLPPGAILSMHIGDALPGEPRRYWSVLEAAARGTAHPFAGSAAEAVDALEQVLARAVRSQMASDVPLGAFLSGGVDSSTVVALMQAHSKRPVRTFAIGYQEAEYNEAPYARAVADHLGTEHTEWIVRPEDALEIIPRLPAIYDEPFADSSGIPTTLVSMLARQHVTVSLSGDGGDELFAGYNRHAFVEPLWQRLRRIPGPLRFAGARAALAVRPDLIDRAARAVGLGRTRALGHHRIGAQAHKLADAARAGSAAGMYAQLVSHWRDPGSIVLGAREPKTLQLDQSQWPALRTVTEQMMAVDAATYLPDDILTKVDRASMSVGLEARVPLLDPEVVEFAWSLPLSLKLRDGHSKWALRQVLYRRVPPALIERPKSGFGVPIARWLRGPLREWAEALLSEDRLRRDGLLEPRPIRAMWAAHLRGAAEWQYHLWDVLSLQAWLDAHGAATTE